MAEESTIKILLESAVKETANIKEDIVKKNNNAFSEKQLVEIEAAFARIANLLKTLDPKSNKGLDVFNAAMNDLLDLLMKGAKTLSKTSDEFKRLQTEIEELTKTKNDLQAQKDTITEKYDEKNNHYYDKDIKDRLKAEDIHYKRGNIQAQNVSTLREKVKEGAGAFASEEDFKKAEAFLTTISTEEKTIEETLRKINEDLAQTNTELTNKKTALVNEAKKSSPEVTRILDTQNTIEDSVNIQKESNRNEIAEEKRTKQIADTTAEMNRLAGATRKQEGVLSKAFRAFSIYTIGLRMARRALRDATRTIKDLDKYLTEQAMVTGKTRKETYALLEGYQKMASELGTTTKEVAQVTTQFMRQGKTTADSLTLTRAAVQAAKVAGISGSESVNYLTTALNGFQLAAEDAMKVSDKFAAIAATSATSYQEIATALSKVASQANIAGMSIDYTTALLAKGIETTREPAESIGTALKTIIARMRELTDYGKTLEDGMNINNVETQLAYVGIALRNTNGELRSTEEVLNELGEKWDTLSSNQQAAVAKALAGTRQQSRLIAMMNDYERVTELQQVAQRSAGATAAQASVYLEGMEAALNRLNVSWEKIVSSVTNSDAIIDLLGFISSVLDKISAFLSTDWGMTATMVTLVALGASFLGQRLLEYKLSQEQRMVDLQRQKTQTETALIEAKKSRLAQEQLVAEKAAAVQKIKNKIKDAEDLLIIQKQKQAKYELLAAETKDQKKAAAYRGHATRAAKEVAKLEKEISTARTEELPQAEKELKVETEKLNNMKNTEIMLQQQNTLLSAQTSIFGKLSMGLTSIISLISMAVMGYKMMAAGIGTVINLTKKEERAKLKAALADKIKAAWTMAGSAGNIPYVGWAIAAAIVLSILGVTIGTAVAQNVAYSKSAEKAADDVNKFSNEIYKLQTKADAIDSVIKKYDDLDKKIVKTIEDQKAMTEALDSAGDKLSSQQEKDKNGKEIKGSSEQEQFKALQSDKAKKLFLERSKQAAEIQADEYRKKQLAVLDKLDPAKRTELLTNASDAEKLKAQDAIFSINNHTLYTYLDTLGNVGDGVEQLTQSILEQMSAVDAYDYAVEKNGKTIKELADAVNNATTVIEGEQVSLAEVLNSTSYSLKEKIAAYDELYASIEALGDQTILQSFKDAYGQWGQLEQAMSDSAVEFMDRIGISIDKLNDFGLAIQKFGLDTKEATERISQMFDRINDGGDVRSSIESLFGDILGKYEVGSKDYDAVYNSILKAYQDAAGTGLLNMGQNLKSLQSRINSLYEKAAKWSTLSVQEQSEFIQDNYDLFTGEQGQELFRAFETGDYKMIQSALGTNEVLKEQIRLRLEQLKIDLSIAEAATNRNEAEISWMKEQIAMLEDYENAASSLYQADLSLRLEQENKQLELYKSYLEKQKDALTESLDERKSAYEKYFNDINQRKEKEEYDNQAEILMSNLSKLSSSTDAGSRQQAKQLEQQLQDLEKERYDELRQKAQEAVLGSLDDEVSQINEKFDKLLENQAALLNAMNNEIAADAGDFISRLATSGIENMSATQAESFIKNDLIPAFDSSISGDILDGIKVRQEGNSLFLTLNNQEIELSGSSQQELSMTILAALRSMGVSI